MAVYTVLFTPSAGHPNPDSTTGVQMAFLKSWAPRALNPLTLRVPDLLPRSAHGPGRAHCLDALEAAGSNRYLASKEDLKGREEEGVNRTV